MPVADFFKDDFTQIITYKLVERSDDLLNYLNLNQKQKEKYDSLSYKRSREYLGLRCCLKELGLDLEVSYDEKGKPFLPEDEHELSITHSYGMVSVGISQFDIGIDIELARTEKIHNIRKKFIRVDEEAWLSEKDSHNDYLHIIWGIKEGLYKLNGGNLWNFLHHYRVQAFDLQENTVIDCWIASPEKSRKYFAYYKRIENYYLIWVLDYE